MFKSLLIASFIITSFTATAQKDTLFQDTLPGQPAIRKEPNQWGVRTTFRVGQSYSGVISILEATYRIRKRHEITVGPILNFIGSRQRSPLLGGHLSYQYFPFRRSRNSLAPYCYYSCDAGSHVSVSKGNFFLGYQDSNAVMAYGEVTNTELIVTNTLGMGVEFRFGYHFYANLAAGLSALYTSNLWEHRFENPPIPVKEDYTVTDIRPGMEIKAGFGWRF